MCHKECMKKQIALTAALITAPLLSANDLKLELIAPKKAFTIPEEHGAPLKDLGQDQKALEVAMQSENADPKKIDELSAKIDKARTIQQGMDLTLRITNNGKKTAKLPYGADTSRNILTIEGDGAVVLPYRGMMTMEFRMPEATEIKAGESKEWIIKNLSFGSRDMDRWYIAKPGTYRASCQILFSHEENNKDETPPQLRTETITFDVKMKE